MGDLSSFLEEKQYLTPGHVITPIGYKPIKFLDSKESRLNPSNLEKIEETVLLNKKELKFIRDAKELKHKERYPYIPRRAELIVKLNPSKYGMKGTHPLYKELNSKINRLFTSTLRKLKRKHSCQ